MKIVGITGTIAAGKGTIAKILEKEHGFKPLSVRGFLNDELAIRGKESNRDNMRELANELRKEHGAGYIVKQLYLQALKEGTSCIIESIRCVGEVDELRKISEDLRKDKNSENPFILLGVDADREVRWERSNGRGGKFDNISFEKFVEQEEKESVSEDPTKQNLRKCLEICDVVFNNDGTFDELEKEVKEYFVPKENVELDQKS
jgi:dephospho-CoA kinase